MAAAPSAVVLATSSLLLLCFVHFEAAHGEADSLQFGFYAFSCPQMETVVADIVGDAINDDRTIAAGLVRLFFHDCFIRGCDASILLDETSSGTNVEKNSDVNLNTLRGLELVDKVKSALEEQCPGVVSCADILAFAAREAVYQSGLSYYPLSAGRRDGNASVANEVINNLPTPFDSLDDLTAMFASKGFSQMEMVVLSGAHSIGKAECFAFDFRLYSFNSTFHQDPSMDGAYAEELKKQCPQQPGSASAPTKVNFDEETPTRLDVSYYRRLVAKKGLLQTDQLLMDDTRTQGQVLQHARDPFSWKENFTKAMRKLGAVGVLVGNQGEVRKSCRRPNAL